MSLIDQLKQLPRQLKTFVSEHLRTVTADTLSWVSVLILHASTIPGILALMSGLTDRPPSLDIVLFVWVALSLLFIRALFLKDILILFTIGAGFMLQASMLASIVFV